MMHAVLLKTRPGSHFHFGQVSVDADTALADTSEHAHSDTLFAALVQIFADVFPDDVLDFKAACDTGQLRVSSVFYCLENEGLRRFFLPKPAHWSLYVSDKSKDYAHIRYISKYCWELGVTPDDLQQPEVAAKFILLQNNAFLAHRSEMTVNEIGAANKLRFFHKNTLPKVTVHKRSEDNTGLYTRTVLQIGDNRQLVDRQNHLLTPDLQVHFYFLEKTDPEWRKTALFQKYQSVLQLLPDCGLGGERSTGCGRLDGLASATFQVDLLADLPVKPVCLSLFSPDTPEALVGLLHYRTLLRGGRQTVNDDQLHYLRMIAEGAVAEQEEPGRIHDLAVTDRIPYWRYGQPFWLDSPYSIPAIT